MKKITFYLGLCDKDSHLQIHSTLESYKTCINMLGSEFGGGSIFEGYGFFQHEDGSVVKEKSLIMVTCTNKDHHDFVTNLKNTFNQESIMVEVSNPSISFE